MKILILFFILFSLSCENGKKSLETTVQKKENVTKDEKIEEESVDTSQNMSDSEEVADNMSSSDDSGGSEFGNPILIEDNMTETDNQGSGLENFGFSNGDFSYYISSNQDKEIESYLGDKENKFVMLLTDKPVSGNIEKVMISFENTKINEDETLSKGKDLAQNLQQIDLLSVKDGKTSILSHLNLSEGLYHGFTLTLGKENYLIKDGSRYPLKVPSSVIKIKGKISIEKDKQYLLVLDFDATDSIIETGKNSYTLKPVIHIQTFAEFDGNLLKIIYTKKSKQSETVVENGETDGTETSSEKPKENKHQNLNK